MNSPLMFITNFGAPEVLVILFIVLLLFGAKKLPDLARSLGKSLGEFKKGKIEGETEEPEKIEKASKESSGEKKEE